MSVMTKTEAAKEYRKIARKLLRLHSSAANHISRKDNNAVFDLSFYLSDVAKRILDGYSDLDYGTPRSPSRQICKTCKDTHRVPAPEGKTGPFGDETWMCTDCPIPCQECRAGRNGPYCERTPCKCDCHSSHYRYRDLPNQSKSEEDAECCWGKKCGDFINDKFQCGGCGKVPEMWK